MRDDDITKSDYIYDYDQKNGDFKNGLQYDDDEPMQDLGYVDGDSLPEGGYINEEDEIRRAVREMTFTDADVWRLRLTAHAVAHTKEGAPLINGTIAAKALGKHPRTVRRWMAEGRFTPHENRLGDSLYLVSEVAAMMDPDREGNPT
jgi:hypothetical protein